MDLEEKAAFYEKQKDSWAGVRELCEAGAARIAAGERRDRVRAALQLAANLESEASAMLHHVRPDAANASGSSGSRPISSA